MGFGEACLIRWGKDGQPVRKDKSILAPLVQPLPPPPGLGRALPADFWLLARQGAPTGAGKPCQPPPHSSSSFPHAQGGVGAASCALKQQWGKAAQTAWPPFSLLFLGTVAPALLQSPRDAIPRELRPGRNSRACGANKKHFSEGLF